jgi:sRNA-binding carbon storage regulator CsrA
MLVLTRRKDQAVVFTLPDGRQGRVIHCGQKFGGTRLGFEFPQDVEIDREELLEPVEGDTPPA